jgi:hypothetical protein
MQCPIKVSSYQNLIQGIQGFGKSLPWLVNRNRLLKIVECCNIFVSLCVRPYRFIQSKLNAELYL